MEADREFKHLCKLCNRSFPCGRSLGGHMRSHLISSQAETGENLKKMNLKKHGSNSKMDKFLGGGVSDGYSLRKNPKKTCRLSEFSAEDRFCRECGRSFQSWKALFGHMKCHSPETERVSSNLEFDSQSSDDEIAASNRGKKSRRRQTRYMAAETSSSFSFANATATAVSSSVSDQNDHEQEEVALCLMMLSRDVGGFYSTTESSDNNSMPKQVPSMIPKSHFSKVVEAIPSVLMGSKMMKKVKEFSEMDSEYLKFEGSNSEFSASVVKMNRNNDKFGSRSSNNQPEFNQSQFISSKFNSDQRKFHELSIGEFRSNSFKRSTPNEVINSEAAYKVREKRTKFQCNSCNKIFHSYQALGGHRASHKKTKGCLASKTEISEENSIETQISNDPTFESKPISSSTVMEMENKQESNINQMGYEKKNKKHHQCSICFKTFSSGQALGGHKRSHLVSGSEPRNKMAQEIAPIQKPEAEIRDYLDLNLPAPIEEEGSSHLGSIEPWWVGGSHSPLVGLI